MSYRDTAVALAQRAPGNFLGVVLYVPIGNVPAKWDARSFPSAAALADWYGEIAGAPTLYYYVAAFDKARGSQPAAETLAPPKPGDPGWAAFEAARRAGFEWHPQPYVAGEVDPDEARRRREAGRFAEKAGLVALGTVFVAEMILSTVRVRRLSRELKR